MKKNAGQIGAWGCKGSGKSTRLRELIDERQRVIAADPMDKDFRGGGFRRCNSKAAILQAIKDGWNTGFKIQVPTSTSRAACLGFLGEFLPALFAVQKPYEESQRQMAGKEITLVLDEADLFFPPGLGGPLREHVETLTRRGRHYGIETMAASQRLAQVGTYYRGTCTEHYFFAQSDHTDIKAALATLGRGQAAALAGLRAHEYLHKGMEAGGTIAQGRNRSKYAR